MHPVEPSYPCCLPALGGFGRVPPHGGPITSVRERGSGSLGRIEYPLTRRIRLVAYGARLEIALGLIAPRGFKSRILRCETA